MPGTHGPAAKRWPAARAAWPTTAATRRAAGAACGCAADRRETVQVALQREWPLWNRPRSARAAPPSACWSTCWPACRQDARGTDLLAETTLGKLLAALKDDLVLKAEVQRYDQAAGPRTAVAARAGGDPLNKGLAVFRPAMTIHLDAGAAQSFAKPISSRFELHYDEQMMQIHVMAE